MAKKGKLLLLPNLLDKETQPDDLFPKSVALAAQSLDGLIAENAKEGRAYLKRLGADYRNTPITLLNKHSQDTDELLAPLRQGQTWGLISDAGLPILADPGYRLVRRARDLAIQVEAFIGPSSLILALMLSGLPAQSFAFHGYLPHQPEAALKELEKRSANENSTQIFIEVPYRNERMVKLLLQSLSDKTLLTIAWDLTSKTQGVETHPVAAWRKRSLPSLHKRPAVFLFSHPGRL